MDSANNCKTLVSAFAAVGLFAAPTVGLAEPTPADQLQGISPVVAPSRAASDSAAISAGAAASAPKGMPSQGCVLPVVDQALPPPASQVLPPPGVSPPSTPAAPGGLGFSTLGLGLAGILGAALDDRNGGNDRSPP